MATHELPINTPDTFGDAAAQGAYFHGNIPTLAPDTKTGPRPAVARVHAGPRANHILFHFLPGQRLKEHKAAHPITVSAHGGDILFAVEGQSPVKLGEADFLHLDAYVPHEVWVEDDAPASAVLWLIMHTG